MQNSPSSTAVCSSPGTWFQDEGRSIPTGANSAEINKQRKAKFKAFIWQLRKKKLPSASSTPVRSSQEISVLWNANSSISDGSVTERPPPPPPPPPATLQRNSPSKPAAAMSDGNNPVPGQQSPRASALQKGEKKQSSGRATAAETDQPMAAPDIIAASADQVSEQVSSVRKGEEEKKKQQATVGTSWIASGFMIIIAGLLMGRMMAIAGLVCFWYALRLRTCRKSR